jgi:dipeptidyl aminopeptidase/acylaminoacyl peptidase
VVRIFAPNVQTLAWSPDGSSIAYLQGAEPRYNAYMQDHLFLVPAAGGAPRAVAAALDRAVMSYAFGADPGAVSIAVEDDRSTYPARAEVGGGAPVRLAPPGGLVVSDLSAAAGHLAMLKADDASFAEVYALEQGRWRKLTGHNDGLVADLKLGAVEDVSFPSTNGTRVHGLVVTPPDFVPGRTYPLLLWIHGGPNGQDQHELAIDGYEFEPQYFAARGFVVLRVNYRGSSGRGGDYARAIAADWGHREVEDLLAGVDYAVRRGIADPRRLAIGGWSYGGILTDYTIASDRRFEAAISGAGSANQLAFYGTDQYIMQYNSELGPPWRNIALWLKVSYPFLHADRIHTPTLFLGGDRDFNVPVIGGEQMYEALRTLGVPTQLAIYPEQHHIVSRPSFVRDLAVRMAAWLDAQLPPPR